MAGHGDGLCPALLYPDEKNPKKLLQSLKKGDIRTANKMLGRYFSYDFEVVHGDARGRILGSPTINQFFSENFTVAEYGVYASFTIVNGKKYISVTNIIRPVVLW